jgi:hypothetical protein
MAEGVGEYEAEDIRVIVARILKDLGDPEPPLKLPHVRALLDLNIGYYSAANTSLLQDIAARLKVAGKQILDRPMLLVEAVAKAKLSALWVPDTKRILIDETVPKPKHRWIEGHEVGHSIIPWHREFLFGDNEYTLDSALDFKVINALSKRFGNTITTTFWRMVEDREPERPVFGMVTVHPRYPEIGATDNGASVRYFIRSAAFREKFANITTAAAYATIDRHATHRKRGPVFDATEVLRNANGEACEFRLESFCNGHALLTYGVFVRAMPAFAR